MQYRIIDADSHLNEPGDVWQSRVPARMKDRAPRLVELGQGKMGWTFDGGKRIVPVAMTATAGISVVDYDVTGTPYDKVRPASYDPHARLKEMEYDMCQAQLLYPSVALTGAHTYSDDRDLQLACVQAYNDWLYDFCAVAPDRLIGLPLAPMTGVEDLLLEWRRLAKRGAKGIILSTYPNGGAEPSPEDDRFWEEIQEWEYAVHIHFGFMANAPRREAPAPSTGSGQPPRPTVVGGTARFTGSFLSRLGVNIFKPLADIIGSGTLERYPQLKVVAVETGIGWIPYFLESLDDTFLRIRWASGVHFKQMPSDIFKQHIWATFITDPIGLELRHRIGVDHIMWSTDYPHVNSDWPNSQRTVAYEFRQVPEDERRKILRDNAAGLYRLYP